jgi:pyridoxine 5'-phosphate synthase PdxJ
MTKLSVNINKIAVVRNSRGGNLPDVVRAALDIERFGAEGITVHPMRGISVTTTCAISNGRSRPN